MQETFLRIKDCNRVKARLMTEALFEGISWKKTNSSVENKLEAYQTLVSRFKFEEASFGLTYTQFQQLPRQISSPESISS